jgi:hypothetical protein
LESREKNNWEGKNFALLTQNIDIETKTLWPSRVKPPVEPGFAVSGVTASRCLYGNSDASLQSFTEC